MENNHHKCVCTGNWSFLIQKYEKYIDCVLIEKGTGDVYYFQGILWASDDYYYLLMNAHTKNNHFVSCCVDLFELYKVEV